MDPLVFSKMAASVGKADPLRLNLFHNELIHQLDVGDDDIVVLVDDLS